MTKKMKRKEVHYEDDVNIYNYRAYDEYFRPGWHHALEMLAAGGVPGKDDLQDFFVYLHRCYRNYMKKKGVNRDTVFQLSIKRDDVRKKIYETLESTRYANIVVAIMDLGDENLDFTIKMTNWR